MSTTVIEVTAGLDWITATLPADCPTGDLWVERGLSCLDQIAAEGYEHYERSLQGYIGISAGNCFVGSREDGHICQLSGYHADRHFNAVFRAGLHISRLDVQVTVKFAVMPCDVARKAYQDAIDCNLRLSLPRRRKLVLITGSDGGDTTYIGSSSSEQRGRIYNKEVQSEDISYRKTWRWEIVLRNDLSTQAAANCPKTAVDRVKWCQSVVAAWFIARGVHCDWHDGDDLIALPPQRTLPTDVERKLRWLEYQVKPSISWLTEKGYGDTLLSVLGLSHPDSSP